MTSKPTVGVAKTYCAPFWYASCLAPARRVEEARHGLGSHNSTVKGPEKECKNVVKSCTCPAAISSAETPGAMPCPPPSGFLGPFGWIQSTPAYGAQRRLSPSPRKF